MLLAFDRDTGVLIAHLCKQDVSLFSQHGMHLFDLAHRVEPGGMEKRFVFHSRETAFKVLMILLINRHASLYVRGYDNSSGFVADILFIYERFTEDENDRCQGFLIALLKSLTIEDENKSPLMILLCRFYKMSYASDSPLIAIIREPKFTEDQAFMLIHCLMEQSPSRGFFAGQRNLDISGSVDNGTSEQYSRSPLVHACEFSYPAVVKLMIEACTKDQINAVYLQLVGSHIVYSSKDRSRVTAIHAAAARGGVEILSLLLAYGADVTLKNQQGEMPLHIAKNAACIELLIAHGADVNAVDNAGRTALHLAVFQMEHLNLNEYWGQGGITAWGENYKKNVATLIKLGACVDQQDNVGRTPLHYMVECFFYSPHCNMLSYCSSMIAMLCNSGASLLNEACVPPLLYLYDKYEEYVKKYAINVGYSQEAALALAKLLVHHGANPAVCSSSGITILHKLARLNDFVAMAYFLDFPAVQALVSYQKTEVDPTPLHIAIEFFSMFVWDLLVRHGANLFSTALYGEEKLTPFEQAEKQCQGISEKSGDRIKILPQTMFLAGAYVSSIMKRLSEGVELTNEADRLSLMQKVDYLFEYMERVLKEAIYLKFSREGWSTFFEMHLIVASYQINRVAGIADVPAVVDLINAVEAMSKKENIFTRDCFKEKFNPVYFELAHLCLSFESEPKALRLAWAIVFLRKAEVDYSRFMAELMGLPMSLEPTSMEILEKQYPLAYHRALRLINQEAALFFGDDKKNPKENAVYCLDKHGNQQLFWRKPLPKTGQYQAQDDNAIIKPYPSPGMKRLFEC